MPNRWVCFKKMEYHLGVAALLALALGASAQQEEPARIPLIDGKTLNGWTTKTGAPAEGWSVEEDGALHFGGDSEKTSGQDLYSVEEYENFILDFEWKVGPGTNSGVKYRLARHGDNFAGPEYQVLDDAGHPDGSDPATSAGSLYDLYPPTEPTWSIGSTAD